MTSPPPPRTDRGSVRRLMLWFLIGVVVLVGLVFYFQFGNQQVPLIDQVK